jgi:hypothetical protein
MVQASLTFTTPIPGEAIVGGTNGSVSILQAGTSGTLLRMFGGVGLGFMS